MPALKALYLDGCTILTDNAFESVGRIKTLEILGVSGTEITDNGLAGLGSLSNLKNLGLWGCKNITDSGLAHLEKHTSLEFLDLRKCKEITDAGMKHVGKLKNLKYLYLYKNKKITDKGIGELAGLVRLERILLTGCTITDAGAAHLGGMKNIKFLSMDGNLLSDEGIRSLSNLSSLESLYLMNCNNITDRGVVFLKEMKGLKGLYLYSCDKVTEKVFQHLKTFSKLEDLSLSGKLITGEGLVHLDNSATIKSILLGGENVTDRAVEITAGFANLEHLTFYNCPKITDKGILKLKSLTNLRMMDLQGTKQISKQAIKELRAAVPSIQYVIR
jgi:Leucine-rich repeat (LRR) protein